MDTHESLLETLRVFTQTAKIMNRTLNRGELIDTVLQESRKISSARVSSVILRTDSGAGTGLFFSYDRRKRHITPKEPLDISDLSVSSATEFRPVDDDDMLVGLIRQSFGVEVSSRFRLPLRSRDELLGFIDLYDPPTDAAETLHFFEVLSSLADLFVIAWDNVEMYERMQRKSLQNNLILESVELLSSSLDLDQVLENMMKALRNVIDYDAVGIFLLKQETESVEPRVWNGYGDDRKSRVRLITKVGEGLVGWVVEKGEGVYVADTKSDPRYAEARPATRSELVVPIKTEEKTIGAFNVESDRLDAYSEEDLTFLSVFAVQAAISIERARLHREILSNRSLEEQLNVARMIQQTFLPQRNPKLAGYEIAGTNIPSHKVGGDYYDFIDIVDHQTGIAIADVSGKGIPASLIMASFRASLIAEIRNNYAIRTIFQKVNKLLNESMDRGNFVTAVYGVLDTKNRIFTFSNAGHNPPLLLRGDGTNEELREGGVALGILDDSVYEERPVYVAPGDVIVLFTDGVTEAKNESGGMYEEERLINTVRSNSEKTAEGLVKAVLDSVNEFVGENTEHDDLTLIIIKAMPVASAH